MNDKIEDHDRMSYSVPTRTERYVSTNFMIQSQHSSKVWRQWIATLEALGYKEALPGTYVIHVDDVKTPTVLIPVMSVDDLPPCPHPDRDCDCWTDE